MLKALVAKKEKKSNVHFNSYGQLFYATGWRSVFFHQKEQKCHNEDERKKMNICNLDYGSPII